MTSFEQILARDLSYTKKVVIMIAMRYKSCPNCGASNRESDTECYSCGSSLTVAEKTVDFGSDHEPSQEELKAAYAAASKSTMEAFIAVCLSVILGVAIGVGLAQLESREIEFPFFLEEVFLGVVCAVATTFAIGKFHDMAEGLLLKRVLPAAAYGALVGTCLFMITWSWDPGAGFPVIGGIAGFCSGLPIVVSFGLFGGESRPLGKLEFLNVAGSLGLGLVIGFFLCLEMGEFDWAPGLGGLMALLPTLFGGRINLAEIMEHFDWN